MREAKCQTLGLNMPPLQCPVLPGIPFRRASRDRDPGLNENLIDTIVWRRERIDNPSESLHGLRLVLFGVRRF